LLSLLCTWGGGLQSKRGKAAGTPAKALEEKFDRGEAVLDYFDLRFAGMKNTFVVISSAGPNRDLSKGTREQPFWDEHAEFIDRLVAEGFILMGGRLVDKGGSLLIFNAEDEHEVREKMKNDPWLEQGILKLESIKRWQIFIDERK
jgi:uncharacterized protein YciI